jgi:hypothetical protein
MMIPVTHELLEDTAGLQPLLERRLRLYIRHTIIRSGISQWLEDRYGTRVSYPPAPFDAEALRPPLPSWPRPHR